MKGLKTIIFFAAVTIAGILTLLNAQALENILLPALCQVDPEFRPSVPTDCMTKVVKLTGSIMVGVGITGKILRALTTTSIFRPE